MTMHRGNTMSLGKSQRNPKPKEIKLEGKVNQMNFVSQAQA